MTIETPEPERTDPVEEVEEPVSDNGGSTQHVEETNKYARNTSG